MFLKINLKKWILSIYDELACHLNLSTTTPLDIPVHLSSQTKWNFSEANGESLLRSYIKISHGLPHKESERTMYLWFILVSLKPFKSEWNFKSWLTSLKISFYIFCNVKVFSTKPPWVNRSVPEVAPGHTLWKSMVICQSLVALLLPLEEIITLKPISQLYVALLHFKL